MSTGAPLS